MIVHACRESGVARSDAYEWREKDPVFAKKWSDAIDCAVEALEAEAYRRAKVGVKKPVFQNGKLVGHVREFGDTLLMFLLKANRPEKYRERYEVTGKDGAALTGVLVIPGTAKPSDWAALVAENTKPGESKK